MQPTTVQDPAVNTYKGRKPLKFNHKLGNRPTKIAILDGDPSLPKAFDPKKFCVGVLEVTMSTHLFKREDLIAV